MTNLQKLTSILGLSIISRAPRTFFSRQTVVSLLGAATLLLGALPGYLFPGTQTARGAVVTTLLSPDLGGYPDVTVALSGDLTVTPEVAPSGTTAINVSTSTDFKGMLTADPVTGVVRVTNAYPAGTYTVTLHADIRGVAKTSNFKLTVQQGQNCLAGPGYTRIGDVPGANAPMSVAIGDFNNDGKQDLAIGNDLSHSVSIRFGDGSGGFSGTTEVSVPDWPESVVIGDFNNDGNQDFAAANYLSNSVSIRLGNGSGGFSATTRDVDVGGSPMSVAVGDFNNDGRQDLAVVADYTSSVAIRLGDGLGGFDGKTNVAIDGYSVSVAIGDFNHDGKQDLAAANYSSHDVSIRFGNGLGGFEGTTNIDVGASPASIAIGDFDNDGYEDFATADFESSDVSIRFGDGAGNFKSLPDRSDSGLSSGASFRVGDSPRSVAIADFNNDGNQDFVTANRYGDSVSIRFGDGHGVFSEPATIGGYSPISVAIGDFNSDGIQDFATANYDNVSIHLGSCGARITFDPLPDKVYGDADFTVTATSSSGLGVYLTASGKCTLSGNMVHLTGSGECKITAFQPGDPYHQPPPTVPQGFTIFKAVTITNVICPANIKYTSSPLIPCSASVTGAGGLNQALTVEYANNTKAGEATASASFAGDANHTGSSNLQNFMIDKADQTITFGELPAKRFGDPDFTVTATASSGLAVSFKASGNCTISSSTVQLTGFGSCTITASQPGDSNYNTALPVLQKFSINAPRQ